MSNLADLQLTKSGELRHFLTPEDIFSTQILEFLVYSQQAREPVCT